jgi:Fe-S cluster biogenesis protein NfuA
VAGRRARLRKGLRRRLEAGLQRLGLLDVPDAPQAARPAPVVGSAAAGVDLGKLDALLDDVIRPGLQGDGGDIEVVGVEAGVVSVRLVGSCNGCPSSALTLQMGIERLLEEELPGFRRLEAVA